MFRYRDPQPQVIENYSYFVYCRTKHLNFWCSNSHLISNNSGLIAKEHIKNDYSWSWSGCKGLILLSSQVVTVELTGIIVSWYTWLQWVTECKGFILLSSQVVTVELAGIFVSGYTWLQSRSHADAIPETRNVNPMSVQCWSIVCDAGPPLNQPWVNVSRLLG